MSCEQAEAVAATDVPHAHRSVTGASEHVQVVRMESYAVDVVVMTDVNAEWLNVICRPEAGGAVVGAGQEVMAVWTPLKIPDRIVVSTISDKTGEGVQRPEADRLVF